MSLESVIDACTRIGLLGVVVLALLFFIYKWVPPAVAWFGNVFLLPIRDAIVGNIGILTTMIMDIKAAVPALIQTAEKTNEMLDERKELDEEQRREGEKNRAAWRTVVTVVSNKCPVAIGCPFRQLKVSDSDEYAKKDEKKE